MHDGWIPRKEDFAEGHFAEVSVSGPISEHDKQVHDAMLKAVSAFTKHETNFLAGYH
jgi:hypothetical protein